MKSGDPGMAVRKLRVEYGIKLDCTMVSFSSLSLTFNLNIHFVFLASDFGRSLYGFSYYLGKEIFLVYPILSTLINFGECIIHLNVWILLFCFFSPSQYVLFDVNP